MKKKAERALKKVGLPILLAVKEGATETQHLRGFSVVASTGEDITIVSNIQENGNKSPFDGVEVAANDVSEEVASSYAVPAEQLADYPVIAHCDKCNHSLLADKSVASALDGVEIHCISCGHEVTAEYFGDFATDEYDGEDDTSDSEDSTDDSSDDSDTLEDDSEDDSSDSEDDTSDDDDVSEEDSNMNDSSENTSDDSSDSEDDVSEDNTSDSEDESTDNTSDSEDESDMSEDDASSCKSDTQTVVPVAACVEDLTNLRLVHASEDRVEVFAGDSHVGHLNLQQANDTVRKLAKNGLASLARAFAISYHKDISKVVASAVSDDLTSFGFVAATLKVNNTKLMDEQIEKARAETLAALEVARIQESEAFVESASIAFAGVNKGILEGPNMVSAMADTLKKYGVKNAVNVAAATMEKVAEPFLKAVLDHAASIRKEGPDYAKGLSRSISTAGYVLDKNDAEFDVSQITAAVHHISPRVEQPKAKTEEKASSYRGLFKRMR